MAGALRAAGVGTWQWDLHSDVLEWDEVINDLFGVGGDRLHGSFEDFAAMIHPDDRTRMVAATKQAIADLGELRIEYRVVRSDGKVRWMEARGHVVTGENGTPIGMTGVDFDVTERRELQSRQQQMQLTQEQARRRLAFLTEAGETLAQSLDVRLTLEQLARLAVVELGDWAVVSLLEAGHLRPVVILHSDPDKAGRAQRLLERYVRPREEASLKVMRTRRTEVLNDIGEDLLRSWATDDEHLELLQTMSLGAIVATPLEARGTMLGTLAVVRSAGAAPFEEDDVTLVNALARRASVAVDNARLYDEQRRLANALQQTLLPPQLPSIPGVDVAARYQPASSATTIGGDFYDVLENAHSSWTVLVGDVRGKGPQAAALTGLARHAARAAALRDPDPCEILGVVNDALLQHDPYEGFCTAVCASLERDGDGITVAVSGCGHPPALVLRSSGEIIEVPSEGLPLGVQPDPGCRTTKTEVAPGDTLLLYTDGVTEARRSEEEFGLGRLRTLLAEHSGNGPDDLASEILRGVETFRDPYHRDDIALLALSPARQKR